jgi:hypothetical protein
VPHSPQHRKQPLSRERAVNDGPARVAPAGIAMPSRWGSGRAEARRTAPGRAAAGKKYIKSRCIHRRSSGVVTARGGDGVASSGSPSLAGRAVMLFACVFLLAARASSLAPPASSLAPPTPPRAAAPAPFTAAPLAAAPLAAPPPALCGLAPALLADVLVSTSRSKRDDEGRRARTVWTALRKGPSGRRRERTLARGARGVLTLPRASAKDAPLQGLVWAPPPATHPRRLRPFAGRRSRRDASDVGDVAGGVRRAGHAEARDRED